MKRTVMFNALTRIKSVSLVFGSFIFSLKITYIVHTKQLLIYLAKIR
ncbi:hypothetical protein ACS5PU_07035 [Pedobacter sp. GSP4]